MPNKKKNEFIFYQRNQRLSTSVQYDNASKNGLKLNMQQRCPIPNKNTKSESDDNDDDDERYS